MTCGALFVRFLGAHDHNLHCFFFRFLLLLYSTSRNVNAIYNERGNHVKKTNIHNTFCNPIVLPDYPTLRMMRDPVQLPPDFDTENFDLEAYMKNRPDTWGRVNIMGENDLMDEMGIPTDRGATVYVPGYMNVPEQDVRATADPSPYYFDGKWYLYPTCGMIYSSEDLVHWTCYHEPTWEKISATMAPTVEKVGNRYVASGNSVPPHVSDSPLGPWTRLGDWTLPDGREFTCGDVMIFSDDDGRAYLYFGCGSPGAIVGAELDVEQPNQLLTYPKLLVPFTRENWWERYGVNNEDWSRGYIEGAWMVKHGERYHLVYSCAGTEYYSYAMGCYISDSPLGDFKPQSRNPVSYNRHGFVKGGGHGGFVKGPGNTLWIFYTIPVSIDGLMERRIGMDPAGFDAEGNLYALTGIDVPQWNPGVMDRPELGNATELMPVSSFHPSMASSYAPGHLPIYAVDEVMHTWWQPAADDPEPTFGVNLQATYNISAVRIMWKDIGLHFGKGIIPGPYRYVVEGCNNPKGLWITLVDASTNDIDLVVDYRTFETTQCRLVRIRILGAPEGVTPGLMNFTVFGESTAKPNPQFPATR